MEQNWGSKIIINYKVYEKGRSILNEILAPYEELSVKQNKEAVHNNDTYFYDYTSNCIYADLCFFPFHEMTSGE